ncbi:MAG TPA: hypothetical protein VGV38_15025 [Pyrinomonadaceae bacterium]|nr:hypothetical protein [Pyrinomonadaceae bacterium]
MTQDSAATFIGSAGVSLLLLAFFLNLFGFLRRDGYAYLLLNLTGGALACYSSHLIGFLPFVVLEGTWAVVAGVAVVRKISTREDESKLSGG